MSEIPEDDEKAAQWLHQLYQHKDKCLDNFFTYGEFDPKKEMKEYEKFEYIEQPRRYYSLINMTCWFVIVCFPLAYYLLKMLLSGDYILISVAISLVLLAYAGMNKLIGLTKISKGSSYGGNATTKHSSDMVTNGNVAKKQE
jgi:lysophosphatidic acid acyltransferase/lysophosphatidylinositol acyltransferase